MPAALNIDLKDSRRYSPEVRQEIQDYLVMLTDVMNRIFEPSLLKELRFTGGDELQGLFQGRRAAYLCLRLFRRMVHPLELHAGIGVGDWTTVVEDRDTAYQDGSAYHYARRAVGAAKRETDYPALLCSGSRQDAEWNTLMNAGFQLMGGNTVRQNELALCLELLYPIWSPKIMLPYRLYGQVKLFSRRPSPLCSEKDDRRYALRLNNQEFFPEGLFPSSVIEKGPLIPIYSYAHPYGAASELASALGLTRQSVDASLRASKVYAERAVALALLDSED